MLTQGFASQRAQGIQAHHGRIVQLVQAFHVEHDDALDMGQALAGLQVLVELLVVLDKQEHAVRVGAEVLDLRCGIGGVNAIADAAHALHGQIGPHPLAAGIGQHRGDLARLETQADQTSTDFSDGPTDLGPGIGTPQAQVLLAHHHRAAQFVDALPEHLGHGVEGQDFGHPAGAAGGDDG